jgi:signal transduction histidine kinase/CheY-like chemotaxis protein
LGSKRENTATEQDIRDLMGLLSLSALWVGRDGQTILQLMMEAVERIVPLRFSYANVSLLPEQAPFIHVRAEGQVVPTEELAPWNAAAAKWVLQQEAGFRAFVSPTPLGELYVVRLSMVYGPHGGRLWFGSSDPGFPTTAQLAFLRAAVSLAGTGLQTARASYERERASQAKDEFLAMLGHELRNPLAPITAALELIKIKSPAPLSREHVIIQRQVQHLSRLVDDLLDVSRITRGKVVLRKEPINLKEVLRRAIDNTSSLLEERRHALTVELPREEMWVFGDATRLAQVFVNLLNNAAKYTDPGGNIALIGSVEGDRAKVVVRDNGSGINPQLFPRLFTIFEQGTSTIDRSKGGLGIGLSLVKSFVELHEGQVTAYSEGPGKGAEFTVSLPLLSQDADVIPAQAQQATPSVRALRILVVDDNVDALETMESFLHAQGHDVRAASDPLQALAMVSDFHPDVALLDIGLPLMDGYLLAAELRKLFPRDALRLIALTGNGQSSDRERSRAAGFDVHLVKPVNLDELLTALHT